MLAPHPWAGWSTRRLLQLLLVFGITTIVISALFSQWDQALRHPNAPYGIISLEMAGTVSATEAVIGPWSDTVRRMAIRITLVDYIYMIAYSSCLALLCLLTGRWAEKAYSAEAASAAKAGRGRASTHFWAHLAWLPWIAAGFDAIENAATLFILMSPLRTPWPQLMTSAAVIKFMLLLFVICVLALGALGLALLPRRRA